MLSAIWLIPALPLIGFVINTLLGITRLQHADRSDSAAYSRPAGADRGFSAGRLAGLIASAAVGLAFLLTLWAFAELLNRAPTARSVEVFLWQWISLGAFQVPIAFLIDPLSLAMMLLVTGVGFLIHVYSIGYMAHDRRQVRYFAYLNLFIVAMLILVMANNYLLMFVGWEGVGLASFLLIGFWFERAEASAAAVKAFIVNRIGDVGLLLAMFALWKLSGTLAFREVFANAPERIAPLRLSFLGAQITAADAITLAILLAVTGKSAQIPLYVWLPDAMAGPTPVSALIHAATMVTAGVYLMVRSHVLFALAPLTLGLVAWVGALTALIGAVIAVGQYDIKKVLAYSTVSQLGYMVAGFGVGGVVAAMFHLLTQGFSKALLFLAAGSVMHGTNDTQDMRQMGGLKGNMPITFWTFVIGALSLAGIPIFASFWSKDEIIGATFGNGRPGVGAVLIVSAVLTAFYMARQVSLIFLGPQRDASYHPHESPPVMTIPLLMLAAGAVLGGLINLPGLSPLQAWLFPLLEEPAEAFQPITAGVTVALAVLGGWAGWRLYGQRPIADAAAPDPLQRAAGGLFRVLEEKLWVDTLYDRLVVQLYRRGAYFVSAVFDERLLDATVDGVARLIGRLSAAARPLQTGFIRTYALVFVLGVVLLIAYFVLR